VSEHGQPDLGALLEQALRAMKQRPPEEGGRTTRPAYASRSRNMSPIGRGDHAQDQLTTHGLMRTPDDYGAVAAARGGDARHARMEQLEQRRKAQGVSPGDYLPESHAIMNESLGDHAGRRQQWAAVNRDREAAFDDEKMRMLMALLGIQPPRGRSEGANRWRTDSGMQP
jgi:hypothetical protein